MELISYLMTTLVPGMNLPREILKDQDVEVSPVTSTEYPQKAYRPRHSIMSLAKVKQTGFKVPTWKEALAEFMGEIG